MWLEFAKCGLENTKVERKNAKVGCKNTKVWWENTKCGWAFCKVGRAFFKIRKELSFLWDSSFVWWREIDFKWLGLWILCHLFACIVVRLRRRWILHIFLHLLQRQINLYWKHKARNLWKFLCCCRRLLRWLRFY